MPNGIATRKMVAVAVAICVQIRLEAGSCGIDFGASSEADFRDLTETDSVFEVDSNDPIL